MADHVIKMRKVRNDSYFWAGTHYFRCATCGWQADGRYYPTNLSIERVTNFHLKVLAAQKDPSDPILIGAVKSPYAESEFWAINIYTHDKTIKGLRPPYYQMRPESRFRPWALYQRRMGRTWTLLAGYPTSMDAVDAGAWKMKQRQGPKTVLIPGRKLALSRYRQPKIRAAVIRPPNTEELVREVAESAMRGKKGMKDLAYLKDFADLIYYEYERVQDHFSLD